jgi:hypothetical protein
LTCCWVLKKNVLAWLHLAQTVESCCYCVSLNCLNGWFCSVPVSLESVELSGYENVTRSSLGPWVANGYCCCELSGRRTGSRAVQRMLFVLLRFGHAYQFVQQSLTVRALEHFQLPFAADQRLIDALLRFVISDQKMKSTAFLDQS